MSGDHLPRPLGASFPGILYRDAISQACLDPQKAKIDGIFATNARRLRCQPGNTFGSWGTGMGAAKMTSCSNILSCRNLEHIL